MVDHITAEQRSNLMRRIRGKDSEPELMVRQIVHAMGYRYRLHRRDLPGTPDLVFPGRRKVVFVHGCFWHQHDCLRGSRPASNTEFWNNKLEANRSRDRRNISALEDAGWAVLIIWECETKNIGWLASRLDEFLRGEGSAITT